MSGTLSFDWVKVYSCSLAILLSGMMFGGDSFGVKGLAVVASFGGGV